MHTHIYRTLFVLLFIFKVFPNARPVCSMPTNKQSQHTTRGNKNTTHFTHEYNMEHQVNNVNMQHT